jgi:hypothetical protein
MKGEPSWRWCRILRRANAAGAQSPAGRPRALFAHVVSVYDQRCPTTNFDVATAANVDEAPGA